jgi:catabolite regulation protein CreA
LAISDKIIDGSPQNAISTSARDALGNEPVRQVGPIGVDLATLTDREEVYSARTSVFFKRTHVYRVLDKKRNTFDGNTQAKASERAKRCSPATATV